MPQAPGVGGWPLVALAALLLGTAGCGSGPARTLSDTETDPTAWLVEDLCHGLPRHPAELLRADASSALQRLALWLGAGDQAQAGQAATLPHPLIGRRARWPLLAGGLRGGALRCDASGMLSLDPAAAPELRDALGPAVLAENHDRTQTEILVVIQSGLNAQAQRAARLMATLRAARVHHAVQTGGPACLQTPQPAPDPQAPAPSSSQRRIGLK